MTATFRGEKVEVVHMDVLVQYCGFFNGRADTNNGYGCKHPECRSRDPESGRGQCFTFSCPVASSLTPGQEPEDDAMLAEVGADPQSESYMMVHDAAVLARLRAS